MRKESEIFKIVLREYIKEENKDRCYLCSFAVSLTEERRITRKERLYISETIEKDLNIDTTCLLFPAGDRDNRIKYLEDKIKEKEREEKSIFHLFKWIFKNIF